MQLHWFCTCLELRQKKLFCLDGEQSLRVSAPGIDVGYVCVTEGLGSTVPISLWEAVNVDTEKQLHRSALFHLLIVLEERSNGIISVPKCIPGCQKPQCLFLSGKISSSPSPVAMRLLAVQFRSALKIGSLWKIYHVGKVTAYIVDFHASFQGRTYIRSLLDQFITLIRGLCWKRGASFLLWSMWDDTGIPMLSHVEISPLCWSASKLLPSTPLNLYSAMLLPQMCLIWYLTLVERASIHLKYSDFGF